MRPLSEEIMGANVGWPEAKLKYYSTLKTNCSSLISPRHYCMQCVTGLAKDIDNSVKNKVIIQLPQLNLISKSDKKW